MLGHGVTYKEGVMGDKSPRKKEKKKPKKEKKK